MTIQIIRREGRARIDGDQEKAAGRSPSARDDSNLLWRDRAARPVRSGGRLHGICGPITSPSFMERSRVTVTLFRDNCSNTAHRFAKRTAMELCSHTENYVFEKCQSRPKRDSRIAVLHEVCNGCEMSNCCDGYCVRSWQPWREFINRRASVERVRAAWVIQGTGVRDERFGRNFAQAFEAPLTVRVGKFFKSWVQGSSSKAGRIRPVVARRVSF
jgi:hypothetical protein